MCVCECEASEVVDIIFVSSVDPSEPHMVVTFLLFVLIICPLILVAVYIRVPKEANVHS